MDLKKVNDCKRYAFRVIFFNEMFCFAFPQEKGMYVQYMYWEMSQHFGNSKKYSYQ